MKRKILIFASIILPLLIAVGFASWIIITSSEKNVNTDYFPYEYDELQTVTYNSSSQEIINNIETEENSISKIEYYSYNEDDKTLTLVEDAINAGRYLVKIYANILDESGVDLETEIANVLFTIEKKDLTITVSSHELIYGDAKDSFTPYVSYEGFVGAENEVNLGITEENPINYIHEYDQYDDYGTYELKAEGFSSDNYNINIVNGKINVLQKEISYVWDETTLLYEYDGINHAPKVNLNGVFSVDTCSANITVDDAETQINQGTYTAEVTGISNNNYILTAYPTEVFTITPRVVALEWNISNLVYTGNILEVVTLTNIVSDDECSVIIDKEVKNAGDYTVTITGLTNDNYSLPEVVSNSFTVMKADYDMTNASWDYTSFTYDGKLKTVQVIGLPTGVTVKNYTNNSYTNAGNYTASVQLAIADSQNYNEVSMLDLAWSIAKVNLVATPVSKTITYGDSVPTEKNYNIAGYVNNETASVINTDGLVYSYNYTRYGNVGAYDITMSGLSATNYDFIYNTGTLTVNKLEISYSWVVEDYIYNGEAQAPTVNITNLVNNDTCSATVTSYTNAGTYVAKISGLSNLNYSYTNATTTSFTIQKATIEISSDLVELSYVSSLRTFNDLYDSILGLITFENEINESILPSLDETTIEGMHNGVFYYGTVENQSNYSTTTNVVGSTYVVYVGEFDNFMLETNTSFVLKYKTAKVDSTYYTIEDAFARSSGDITLEGDSTESSTYVYTGFSLISLDEGYPYSSNYIFTVTSKNIVVPYDSSSTPYTTSELKNGNTLNTNVYSALNIPDGVTINLVNSTLTVASAIYHKQPDTSMSGIHGVIVNDGIINASGSSTIKSYGYIKSSSSESNGQIILESGTTTTDVMKTYDWPGGNTATKNSDILLPLNAWTLHNISCKTKIMSGAIYNCFFYAKATLDVETVANVIGNSSTPDSLFICKSGYIIKSTKNSLADPNATDMYTVEGSNQIKGQKDIIEMYGEIDDSKLTISISGYDIKTSSTISCPSSYLDVKLVSGTLNIDDSDFVFLPGTTLEICENATLNVDANIDISFEKVSNISNSTVKAKTNYAFYNHCVDKIDAKAIINGTLNCSGNIGGTLTTTKEGVNLNLTSSSANLKSSFLSLYNAVGASASSSSPTAYKVSNLPASGCIANEANGEIITCQFTKSIYTSAVDSNGSYYWIGEQGSTESLDGTIDTNQAKVGGCIAAGTLITLSDGTRKPVEDLTLDDELLIFNHETGKYDKANIIFIDDDGWKIYDVINLVFSDGTTTKVIYEHGFFDLDLMQYVYINESTYKDYIGHEFYKASLDNNLYTETKVTLVDAYIAQEYTGCYSLVTAYHLNYFTDDLLSMPGGIDGLFNIFEYDDNLQYNQESMNNDIEEYGLFTYEDFADLIPYEVYCVYPAPYFKVAIGKGILTWDDLYYYIERYAS